MKGVDLPEKTTLKKPSLIRANSFKDLKFFKNILRTELRFSIMSNLITTRIVLFLCQLILVIKVPIAFLSVLSLK